MSAESKSASVSRFNNAVNVGLNKAGVNSILSSIVLGGIFISVTQTVVQSWFVYHILQKTPFVVVLQYIASGAKGLSAFQGGNNAAALGLLIHVIISFVVATVFILSADRIHFLRRYVIPGALLYGFGVWVVMHKIVTPLSATPPIPAPETRYLIEEIVEHILLVGLPLGILAQRNMNTQK